MTGTKEAAKVFLVGAGPGDPEMLTVKAMRLLHQADVVVYDRLVSDEIMELVPPGVSRIFVGKESGYHCVPQDEINRLLVGLARSGRTVVRLKGGDPFIFGRGSEETAVLSSHDIAWEVVPGITAASACASAIGVPLTHRGVASGVRFVTGHLREDQLLDLDWRAMADPSTTLVVYMGLGNLKRIAGELIAAGLPATTPTVAIANGTKADQQTCRADLIDLPAVVRASGLKPPVLFVIGKVVALNQVQAAVDEPQLQALVGAAIEASLGETLSHG